MSFIEEVIPQIEGFKILVRKMDGKIVYPSTKKDIAEILHILANNTDENNIITDNKSHRFYDINQSVKNIMGEAYKVTIIRDITKYKSDIDRLGIDQTTGIKTRALTYQELSRYIKSCRKNKESFAFAMFDLDDFKSINENYGHLAGDFALRMIADTLTSNTRQGGNRPTDIVGRYGGDEFMVVLKNITRENALRRHQEINQRISELSMDFDNKTIKIGTASAGVHIVDESILKENDDTPLDIFRDEIIDSGDKALFLSKNLGKNRVSIW